VIDGASGRLDEFPTEASSCGAHRQDSNLQREVPMTRIFVPQPIPEPAVDRLKQLGEVTIYPHTDRQIPRDELLEAVGDKHVLFAIGEIPFDERVFEAAKELKLIAAMHGSAKFVDFAAASRRKIPVTGIPMGYVTKTTAEFTFALLMATAWRLPEADAFLREGRWRQNQSMALLSTRLFGKTLGIVGMGQIGQMVARRAVACDMRIIYNKRNRLSPAEEFVLGGAEFRSLQDLFIEADFIALTPALTKDTKGMIGERLISLMKPSAILINTSRGPVLDEAALEKALRAGRIRGAGLDVYHTEVPEPNPGPVKGLMSLPNVVFTPHIGSAARETREEMALRTVRNIECFLAGERPLDVLNPEVYGEAPRKDERIG
jgi:lactate dehydrogenase-like 2-hydroxyacid dehydrogenase